ncbi:MAG: cyclic nucleotide-binding domain-containing protein, partial [Anaerolineales bacterium]|nr:cyclic nucleotide-binding domain-containing protein [Anaerolineales bacterium]
MRNQKYAAKQALQLVPFFNNLQDDEAKNLSKRLVLRRFGPDQVIFHHGDPGGLLYIITKGKVKITHSTL